MMHRFRDPSINNQNSIGLPLLSPDLLEDCLKYLTKNNYTVLSLKDVIQAAKENQPLYKTVCFTIDDGYIDFKNVAFPLFKKYNFPATVFITTDFIEGKLAMWWDIIEYLIVNTNLNKVDITYEDISLHLSLQSPSKKKIAIELIIQKMKLLPASEITIILQYLSRKVGTPIPNKLPEQYRAMSWTDIMEIEKFNIDFQPHTVNHPILFHLNDADQKWQIKMSSEMLRKKLGSKPNIFCYPNGELSDFTKKTISTLKKENFIGACTTESNVFHLTTTDLFKIPRFSIPAKYYKFVLYVSGCKALQLAIIDKLTPILGCWTKSKSGQ